MAVRVMIVRHHVQRGLGGSGALDDSGVETSVGRKIDGGEGALVVILGDHRIPVIEHNLKFRCAEPGIAVVVAAVDGFPFGTTTIGVTHIHVVGKFMAQIDPEVSIKFGGLDRVAPGISDARAVGKSTHRASCEGYEVAGGGGLIGEPLSLHGGKGGEFRHALESIHCRAGPDDDAGQMRAQHGIAHVECTHDSHGVFRPFKAFGNAAAGGSVGVRVDIYRDIKSISCGPCLTGCEFQRRKSKIWSSVIVAGGGDRAAERVPCASPIKNHRAPESAIVLEDARRDRAGEFIHRSKIRPLRHRHVGIVSAGRILREHLEILTAEIEAGQAHRCGLALISDGLHDVVRRCHPE